MIDVYIQELTPESVKHAENLAGLVMLISVIGLFITMTEQPILYFPGFPAILIGGGILQRFLYQALRTETRVLFTPTEFKVLRRGRWDVYDRHLKHSFVMLKHDEARQEREKQECQARAAQAKGQYSTPRRYYDDSFHMVLEYFGQRHDIATVFDEKRARAVIARLQACDSMMDSHIRMGDSHTLSPEEEWGAQPGGLPGQHR
ncbi:hypothetical protein ACOJCM_10040 [Billgrantia sp. LNSP4103-1]|uniref:hypothetical protein n=1 Tax=Billgrantia sp. LNSP4103-1 TaxID=3410266 RepID=UPI00403FA381